MRSVLTVAGIRDDRLCSHARRADERPNASEQPGGRKRAADGH